MNFKKAADTYNRIYVYGDYLGPTTKSDTSNKTPTKYIETSKEEIKMSKEKLYSTLDGKVFGTLLTTDSDGKLVLKLASGDYKAFAEAEVKRVMPFTYGVKMRNSNTVYHYLGDSASISVDDVLLDTNDLQIAVVVAVNTESEVATKKFSGVKLLTQKI